MNLHMTFLINTVFNDGPHLLFETLIEELFLQVLGKVLQQWIAHIVLVIQAFLRHFLPDLVGVGYISVTAMWDKTFVMIKI